MENFALVALVEQLKRASVGMSVRRIVQLHASGFMLQSRTTNFTALKIALDSRNLAIYLSDARPPIELTGSDFLMVLRKHLTSARLTDVRKPLSERIVELEFKTPLPAKELGEVTLVVELRPNAPNIWLLDRARRILAGSATGGARRDLTEYEEYTYPSSRKIDLVQVRGPERDGFDMEAYRGKPRQWLIETIAGVGPVLAGEVVHRQQRSGRHPLDELADILDRLEAPLRTVWTYASQPLSVLFERNDLEALRRVIVSPIELESLRTSHAFATGPSILDAVRTVYDEIESRALLEKEKAPRLRELRDERRRVAVRRARLEERQRQFEGAPALQAAAQMLVASGEDMTRRLAEVEVVDYFGDRPRKRTIEVDPSRTLRENVDRMFKQHRKAGRGLAQVSRQLTEVDEAERRLEALERRLASIGDWTAWKSLGLSRREESETPRPPASGQAPRRSRAIQFDGHEVLVGRSSKENDEITFRVAAGDDFWLHVAGYSGSHVIVRNPRREQDLDPAVLLRAAELAAYYSQARNSNKVDVHYTQRKFVTKPRRAKPGLVQLRQFRTLTVEPRNWLRESDR